MRRPAFLVLAWLALSASDWRAIDGDTMRHAVTGERVRLMGFDAPELHGARCEAERALAEQARAALAMLLERDAVTLTRHGRDRYGRTLARVLVSGDDVALIMITHGFARPYRGGRRAGWC